MTDDSFDDSVRAPAVDLPGGPRRWVEDSFGRLTEQFGADPLRRPAVVPDEFVPAGYDGSEAAAREVCRLVCERMGIAPDRVQFSFRLEKVVEAAELLGSAMLDMYVEPDSLLAKGSAPGDLAAVRTYSNRLGTASFAKVDRIVESELTDGSDENLLPLVHRLGIAEFGTEVVRCLLIAAAAGPEQRPDRLRPPKDAVRPVSVAGRWIDLAAKTPGAEPAPGRCAVMLRSDVITDASKLLATVSHELSHELLSRAELPWVAGPLEEPLADLCALFHGFGIALVNGAVDETTLDDEWVHTAGYLGEHAFAEALASYRFRQHRLVRDGPLVPDWYQALDPVPKARFLSRLDELIGGPPTVLGW
jgi:hypothetical protein